MHTRVRSWHGLEFDIRITGQRWAKLDSMPPHPQLVNMVIRRGLDTDKNLEMQVLHELGHVQAFPFVFAYYLPVYLLAKPASVGGWVLATAGMLFFWELLAEAYVCWKRSSYFKDYAENLSLFPVFFWITALIFMLLPFL